VITFELVPPGAQPTRITPTASSGGSWSRTVTSRPTSGMITYCATTPMSTGSGRLTTSAKSGIVRVRPIANMMMPR
jgi:hypothetical protein